MSKDFLKVRKGLSYKSLPTPPVDPQQGDTYHDTSLNVLRVYRNSGWLSVGEVYLAKVTLIDTVSTTLPPTDPHVADGVTVLDGDTILFTNLSSGNNQIYYASIPAPLGAITWTALPIFNGNVTPALGDVVLIKAGNTHTFDIYKFNGTSWVLSSTLQEAYENGNTITTSFTYGDVLIAGTQSFKVSATNGIDVTNTKVSTTDTVNISNGLGGRLVLQPNRTGGATGTDGGALQADTDGDPRGKRAVDFQTKRAAITQVASGNYSFIGNGTNNTASAIGSSVVSGGSNTNQGQNSIIGSGVTNSISNTVGSGGIVAGVSNNITDVESFIGAGGSNTVSNVRSAVVAGTSNTASGIRSFVGGGQSNISSNTNTFIGSGVSNTASGDHAVIVGGNTNTASGVYSFIGNGQSNQIIGGATYSAIPGGNGNTINGSFYGFIGGGLNNTETGSYIAIAGGESNSSSGTHVSISGGKSNTSNANYSAIGGGELNTSLLGKTHTTIAGGKSNNTSNDYATIGGGLSNTASEIYTSILGGQLNTASGFYSVVVGGINNTASGQRGFVGGGQANTAVGSHASTVGGLTNQAQADYSIIGGGQDNTTASGATHTAILGGLNNTVMSGGHYSSVLGGAYNSAGHIASLSGGYGAATSANFDFVLGNNAAAVSGSINNVHFRIDGVTSNLVIGRSINQASVAGAANELRLQTINASNQSNYIGFRAPTNLTASQLYTLPPSPVENKFLQTDASGNLSWSNPWTIQDDPSSPYTAKHLDEIFLDLTLISKTVNLPSSPFVGMKVRLYDFLETIISVSSFSRERLSNLITITTNGPHGLSTGQTVRISGLGGTGYNTNTALITVTGVNTFTYTNGVNPDEGVTLDSGGFIIIAFVVDPGSEFISYNGNIFPAAPLELDFPGGLLYEFTYLNPTYGWVLRVT